MTLQELVEQTYDYIQKNEIANATMVCLRISRRIQDYLNTAVFLRETTSDKHQVRSVFLQDTRALTNEAREYLWKRSQDIWISERDTAPSSEPHDDAPTVIIGSISELEEDIRQFEKSADELQTPPGMHPLDTATFNDRYTTRRVALRGNIRTLNIVTTRIKSRCHNYAIQVEKQLEAQEKPNSFVLECQTEVNNYFKAQSQDVYDKLISASQFVDSKKKEDHSLLLTSIRRAIDAVADHFQPAVEGPVKSADGQCLDLGPDKHLNRLQVYLTRTLARSSSTDLLKAELDCLSVFVRRLNALASKGVHSEVTPVEAKQGLLALYMFLYNLVSRLQYKPAECADDTAQN